MIRLNKIQIQESYRTFSTQLSFFSLIVLILDVLMPHRCKRQQTRIHKTQVLSLKFQLPALYSTTVGKNLDSEEIIFLQVQSKRIDHYLHYLHQLFQVYSNYFMSLLPKHQSNHLNYYFIVKQKSDSFNVLYISCICIIKCIYW